MYTMEQLAKRLEAIRNSQHFADYLEIRNWVLKTQGHFQSSSYWQEETAGFEYVLDASPLIIEKLREHCYHITGLRSYDYRRHHQHLSPRFASKLAQLKAKDTNNLFVPESPLLGGFGHSIDGHLVNIDTLKFYECLIALASRGIWNKLKENPNPVIVEIGTGWGGLAYQIKTLLPHATYVLIDLPMTMLFSALYLKTHFPDAQFYYYEDSPANREKSDFVFIPHFATQLVELSKVDLCINVCSFQEMTSEQVRNYARLCREWQCPIYSLNRDRSSHNNQLSAVSEILSEVFELEQFDVLPFAYNELTPPAATKTIPPHSVTEMKRSRRISLPLLDLFKHRAERTSIATEPHVAESQPPDQAKIWKPSAYRHIVGQPKSSV